MAYSIDLGKCQEFFLPDFQATFDFGVSLGSSLSAGSVLLLEGDLGAGKTTLVQGIARGLGIDDFVLSPTFSIINEYLEGRIPLYHLDLYRLNSAEVESMFLELYWEGVEIIPGITAIEWPQRLSYKPDHFLHINLVHFNDGRQVFLTPY